jgi:hypothetical protein
VSPVKYEPGFYIPEDGILHSHCRGNLKYCREMRVLHQICGSIEQLAGREVRHLIAALFADGIQSESLSWDT